MIDEGNPTAPVVSVVLPTYNRAATIGRAVRSVLAQTYRNVELIVVDDGPDDATENIIAGIADPRVRYVRRSGRLGVSSARNHALELARGEFVAFQDSDDEWCVEKLELQVEALRSHPDASMTVCGFVVPNELSQSLVNYRSANPVVDVSDQVALRLAGCQCWLVRREALLALKGFDPRLDCFEDWELALRLSDRGRVLMVNQSLVIKPLTQGSLFSEEHFARNLKIIVEDHRERFRADPVAWSSYCNLLGQAEYMYGSRREARAWFVRAMVSNPVSPRSWGNLLFSMFGTAAFRRYVQVARALRAQFFWRRSVYPRKVGA